MKTLFLSLLLLSQPAEAALKLQSGKNFLYEHDPKALASSVQIVFRSGSTSDPTGKEGLANIAYNSLLRGTKEKSRKAFIDQVEQLGGSLSVDAGSNRAILSLNALSDNLEPAIRLLAEAILQPGLREDEIKSLFDEELAKLNQEKSNNRALLQRSFRQALFQGTPLAIPPSGTIQSVSKITIDDIRSFLTAHTQSANVLVAVNSNRSEKEVRAWVEKAFTTLPEGQAPAAPKFQAKKPKGRRLFVLDRKGSSTTEVAIGHLGFVAAEPIREVLETGLFVFGSDFTSRLSTVLRKDNGWTYGAYASYRMLDQPRRHGGSFLIYTFPQAEFTEKAALKAVEMYTDYVKKGVTAKELKFAQDSLVNSYAFKFATSKSRLTARLYSLLDGAPNLSVPQYKKLVNGITRDSLLQAVKRFHDPENFVMVLVGDPEKTKAVASSLPGIVETIRLEEKILF
jgi:zinc protease